MKRLLGTLLIAAIPFMVVSCDGNKQVKKENKTDLKELIKANNAYADINWVKLEELDEKMKKEPRKVMIYFYREGCPYCKEMKATTLVNPSIIKLVNDNFYAVMVDGKSKDPMTFNGVDYVNDHPAPEDAPWRHNLFAALIDPYNGGYYWPSTVFLNEKYEKFRSFPGQQKTPQFQRVLQNMIRR
jgi:thioredoxin-related protein